MDEVILYEANTNSLNKKRLYVAANEENFKKLFEILGTTNILYYYDLEGGRAEFCDAHEITRISLICNRHNISRIGRVHELYIDSDCEIHSSLALYVPLCNLPGAKPFELIDISRYKIVRGGPLLKVDLLEYDEADLYVGVLISNKFA